MQVLHASCDCSRVRMGRAARGVRGAARARPDPCGGSLCVAERGRSVRPVHAHSAGHPWPAGDPLTQTPPSRRSTRVRTPISLHLDPHGEQRATKSVLWRAFRYIVAWASGRFVTKSGQPGDPTLSSTAQSGQNTLPRPARRGGGASGPAAPGLRRAAGLSRSGLDGAAGWAGPNRRRRRPQNG